MEVTGTDERNRNALLSMSERLSILWCANGLQDITSFIYLTSHVHPSACPRDSFMNSSNLVQPLLGTCVDRPRHLEMQSVLSISRNFLASRFVDVLPAKKLGRLGL